MPKKESGSVNHRFLTAILQKVSIKIETVPIFIQMELIPLLIHSIEENMGSKNVGLHFTNDFGSALLANLLHAPFTHGHLKKNSVLLEFLLCHLLALMEKHS